MWFIERDAKISSSREDCAWAAGMWSAARPESVLCLCRVWCVGSLSLRMKDSRVTFCECLGVRRLSIVYVSKHRTGFLLLCCGYGVGGATHFYAG